MKVYSEARSMDIELGPNNLYDPMLRPDRDSITFKCQSNLDVDIINTLVHALNSGQKLFIGSVKEELYSYNPPKRPFWKRFFSKWFNKPHSDVTVTFDYKLLNT